jgi:hypothetical protein
MQRVRQDLNPHYDEAHRILNKIAGRTAKLWNDQTLNIECLTSLCHQDGNSTWHVMPYEVWMDQEFIVFSDWNLFFQNTHALQFYTHLKFHEWHADCVTSASAILAVCIPVLCKSCMIQAVCRVLYFIFFLLSVNHALFKQ